MKSWYSNLNVWTVLVVAVVVLTTPSKCCGADGTATPPLDDTTSSSRTTSSLASLRSSIKLRLLERRQLHSVHNQNKNRKLIEVSDVSSSSSSAVVDGQYIVVFDPDLVVNATATAMQLFHTSQILYVLDNIVMKGVAIRNVTTDRLHELDADARILSLEPVRLLSVTSLFR